MCFLGLWKPPYTLHGPPTLDPSSPSADMMAALQLVPPASTHRTTVADPLACLLILSVSCSSDRRWERPLSPLVAGLAAIVHNSLAPPRQKASSVTRKAIAYESAVCGSLSGVLPALQVVSGYPVTGRNRFYLDNPVKFTPQIIDIPQHKVIR